MQETHGIRPITLADLDFDRLPVRCRSTSGVEYFRWQRVGMPRISDDVIESVFFLYANSEDAKAGKNPGGTGFILSTGRNLWVGGGEHLYGVTNWHVAVRDGFSVVRINKRDGGTDILDFGPEDWEFMPGGPDVAVVPLTLDHSVVGVHKASSISIGLFASQRSEGAMNQHNYAHVGDDVFMLGLFVDHNGKTTNVPSARFGNISMEASVDAPIEQSTKYLGPSHVVDMHSRTGFSGSPVFVYRTLGSDLTDDRYKIDELIIDKDVRGATIEYRTFFKFLGILWAQFPEQWELRDKDKSAQNKYVEGMSGMSCVIPSWEIERVLRMPKLQKMREMTPKQPARVVPKDQSASPAATDENPQHREDFNSLLGKAAQQSKK